jgi:gluconate 2-dehydrogenase alpha chain
LFGKAARELGYKPFPQPSGNLSRAYTNPLGLRLGPCTYCGFCEWFGCANYSKASPTNDDPPCPGAKIELLRA